MSQLYVQRDQPPGVPPLSLTGERTLPDVPEENYWFRRHLVVYEWIAARAHGRRVVDLACGEGYGSAVLASTAVSVVGVDANPEAFEHARLKYPGVRFERNMIELWTGNVDCVVFLQTIEHVQDPDGVLDHIRELVGPKGVAYVSTPNVLTLAPKGAERSGNPWHVREYRAEEYRALCERHFGSVDLAGPLPRAQAARPRVGAQSRLGRRARAARHHPGVLRPLHAGHLHARLRAPAAGPRPRARLPGGAASVTRLSIVLHTHMPYVEGFGTWPFGEEWLWEAIATSYLPLLDVLDAHPGRVTVSLTPVLCDQLEAPGALERCLAFLREIRPASHELDIEEAEAPVAAALERSAASYAAAADALERRGDLLAAFAPHATWTSAATHPVLPLLATGTGVRLQLRTGIASHRARFGEWGGGFWLPECAHAPWLDDILEEAGVRVACVDWTDVLGPGPQAPRCTEAGVVLAPLDREAIELVWHRDGYPAGAPYLDTHRLTEHRHRAWANDGAVYDPGRAAAQVAADAEDFVRRVAARGGPSVVALDTELLGHFWPEGVDWLRAVLEACSRHGVELVPPGEGEPVDAPADPPVTSWGDGRDLRTWSGPAVGGLAWAQRGAELRAFSGRARPSDRALRELLALQASDWAFLISAGTAGDYPRERAEGHRAGFEAALADPAVEPGLRSLAPLL